MFIIFPCILLPLHAYAVSYLHVKNMKHENFFSYASDQWFAQNLELWTHRHDLWMYVPPKGCMFKFLW